MKKIIKNVLHNIGLDIVRYKDQKPADVILSKKTGKLKLHNTESGRYYLPEDAYQDVVANTIINNEVYDKEIIDCARDYINPGDTVLDIGANFGQMSVLYSQMVGKEGKVYSFEADDFIFDILKKNILVNECLNITPIFGAVHDVANDVLVFPEPDFNQYGTYGSFGLDYNKTKNGREVPTLTIDSLNIQENIKFIKIDVQGGDLYALKGSINTIKKYQMPILFEFEYLFQDSMHLDFQEYVDFVSEIGYKFKKVINGQNYLIVPKTH